MTDSAVTIGKSNGEKVSLSSTPYHGHLAGSGVQNTAVSTPQSKRHRNRKGGRNGGKSGRGTASTQISQKRSTESKEELVVVTSPAPKKLITFLDLPFELRERIMTIAYQMTIAELPASHPHITHKPLSMSKEAVRRRRRRNHPAAETVLYNPKSPDGLSVLERKKFLRKHPGQFGPIFQVMYTCKALYEEARAIRYREIRILASNLKVETGTLLRHKRYLNADRLNFDSPKYDDSVLMERLSNQVLKDYTKHVVLEIQVCQETALTKNLVAALEKFESLKHLFIIVKVYSSRFDSWSNRASLGGIEDLLLFFDLKIDSLTIRFEWADPALYKYYKAEGNYEGSERIVGEMVQVSSSWEEIYRSSVWHPENNEKISDGRVVKYISAYDNTRFFVDQFFFTPVDNMHPTPCPNWKTRIRDKNPCNHPSQFWTWR